MNFSYKTPIRDTLFIINEVLNVDSYLGKGRFSNLSKEDITIILEQGSIFVESEIYPLNKIGDHHGCVLHKDHSVSTPPGFREVYHEFCKGGWNNLGAPLEFGGQGLPTIISTAFEEYSISANMAFSMYPGLTQDAVLTISSVGTLAQETYIPLVERVWSGTMNLTEPQCGPDLGLIDPKQNPRMMVLTKPRDKNIYIEWEHDLTENIIHLVVARIPGESKNTKGLSMFKVPKLL